MKLNQWQIAAIVAVLVISVAALVFVIKGRSDQAVSTQATTESTAATKEENKPAEKKKQKKTNAAQHKPEPRCSATDKMLHANGC